MSTRSFPLFSVVVLALLLASCTDREPPAPDDGDNTTIIFDTTSHDFVWDITQIGIRHTMLLDIEAISDTDVWICGEIHFENTNRYDSLGNYIKPFNLAHWDGREWSYMRLKWPSEFPLSLTDICAIKAFSHDDIWFFTGGKIAHLKDGKYLFWELSYEMSGGYLMEGTPGNLYFAGRGGRLMHFDGTEFRMLNSGTTQDFNDAWTADGTTMIVANTMDDLSEPQAEILLLGNGKTQIWSDSAMYRGATCLWFHDLDNGIIAGPGIRVYRDGRWSLFSPDNRFKWCVRGTDVNDIFVAGNGGYIYHFNGASWHFYDTFATENYFRLAKMSYIQNLSLIHI